MKIEQLLSEKLDGVAIKHSFKMSADEEAKRQKISITLNGTFLFDDTTVGDMCNEAVRNGTIKFVAANRPKYKTFKNGQQVIVLMASAGRKVVDHVAATGSQFLAADDDGRRVILARVMGIKPEDVPEELLV